MKILSNAEYNKLQNRAYTLDEVSEIRKDYQIRIEELERSHSQEIEDNEREYNQQIEDKNQTISHLKKDKDFDIKQLKDNHELAIKQAIQELVDQLNLKEIELAQFKTKCEVLESAFKNLGFDVKDTKELMIKMVDGLSSKHEVTVIK